MFPKSSLRLVALSTLLLAGLSALSHAQDRDPPPPTTRDAEKVSEQNPEATPATLPGAVTFVYRDLEPEPVRLHIFKPKDAKTGEKRTALIWFFGGGFTHGTPDHAAGWAKWAAKNGAVGIAPDYRTMWRFKTSAADCVRDGRAAMRWVQDHADELGIDPKRIIVGGNSAGGSLAIWTAIEHSPPGFDENEKPLFKPLALILTSAPTDIVSSSRASRFGNDPLSYSPLQQLDEHMPPTIMFHGDADTTVPYDDAVKLHDKLVQTKNDVEFITIPGGNHNYPAEWKKKVFDAAMAFLVKRDLMPVSETPRAK